VSSKLAAVVLAAGASRRMGRPKALLQWRGRPFVTHALRLARAVFAAPLVVVEGAVPLPAEALEGARKVCNTEWAEGPLGSLTLGLRALGPELGGAVAVLVLTVDRPHLDPRTVQALAAAVAEDPHAIWQPRLGERRGHPIAYPVDLVPELLAPGHEQTPRELLARAEVAARRRQIAVQDAAVLDNLDRPEDLARLPP